MWRILEPQREPVRQRLARAFGCDGEEIALTRNASEGLQICQFGFDLEPGDEVLTTTQDYGRMITTFKQRERREGIVLRQFDIPVPAEDPAEIVRLFESHITPRTRLILMCHMINLTGQILPVREVVAMGRRHGLPVIVDGAHSFAHFDFEHRDLDCDYYATSLHKWLFAPHGTGMLYVRRNLIADLWPLMAAPEPMSDDIRKFEEIGTHPAANYLAIAEALTFHQGLGAPTQGGSPDLPPRPLGQAVAERRPDSPADQPPARIRLRHRHRSDRGHRHSGAGRLPVGSPPDLHRRHRAPGFRGHQGFAQRLLHHPRGRPLHRGDAPGAQARGELAGR